jgi:NAD(P)-dependent dehydrogenase (short-subunit alcohol dehydrogenase family)
VSSGKEAGALIASRFVGKAAIVTGAGSGMGAAIARRLVAQGADQVVLADVNVDSVKEIAGRLERASAVGVDVSDSASVDAAFEAVTREHGRVDVVVHAAGVDDPASKQLIADALANRRSPEVTAAMSDGAWRRVLSINLDGTFYVLRAAVRAMRPKQSGSIVVIGSSAPFDAPTGYPSYSASKAGVHALSQSVAKEAIAFGVRVNVVAPGPTDTGMAARTPAALKTALADPHFRPYATPEEIADVALFLASDEAVNVVGAVLLANGGRFTA